MLKTSNAIHRGLLKLSGGRLGWDLGNMPVVEPTNLRDKPEVEVALKGKPA
jgi:hypothetical protein